MPSSGLPLPCTHQDGWVPLAIAEFTGRGEVCRLLLLAGADPSAIPGVSYPGAHTELCLLGTLLSTLRTMPALPATLPVWTQSQL